MDFESFNIDAQEKISRGKQYIAELKLRAKGNPMTAHLVEEAGTYFLSESDIESLLLEPDHGFEPAYIDSPFSSLEDFIVRSNNFPHKVRNNAFSVVYKAGTKALQRFAILEPEREEGIRNEIEETIEASIPSLEKLSLGQWGKLYELHEELLLLVADSDPFVYDRDGAPDRLYLCR